MSAGEKVRYWRHPGMGGLDLMRARYVGHRFSRHSHDTYAIGAVESGAEAIHLPGGLAHAGVHEVVLIDPGVVHTGHAHTPGGWTYRVLYPTPAQLTALTGRDAPSFARPVVTDARLAALVVAAHRAAETEDPLTADIALHLLLARLVATQARPRAAARTLSRALSRTAAGPTAAARARDLLHACLSPETPAAAPAAWNFHARPPGLRELAEAVGTTPFALVRAFRRAYGLPPHAYLTQLRVRRARELLARGTPPAEAAQAAGFCDQSHLSRHFRRIVGTTPGAYQRAVQEHPIPHTPGLPTVSG
ncbi:helix-turn-helix transcriptional regulator [Nonomuraea ceibae]|uniref:helix-turn-helix transcriptional regulator n=1 Tax=Nonomuraea ceibae TaxID=1935170 RepID=UPI001FE316C0|nr:AraC family transcriptional regulator [Nonomuraea ceibae]